MATDDPTLHGGREGGDPDPEGSAPSLTPSGRAAAPASAPGAGEAPGVSVPSAHPDRALPVSAVVPVLDAEDWVESCLRALAANRPAELIVVNGPSKDATAERASALADTVVDAGTESVAQARNVGAVLSRQPWIAFVDVDVVLPPGALAALVREAEDRGLDGLQAGFHSVGAGDYWSEALARHHNIGRSRHWFGLGATVIRRELVLESPLDETFHSGEDIEYRYRLRRRGARTDVSTAVQVEHRFRAGYPFASGQWLADGAGLGRLVRKYGRRAIPSALIPFGAAALGVARSLGPSFSLIPYWLGFALGNLVGLLQGLADTRVPIGARQAPSVPQVPPAPTDDPGSPGVLPMSVAERQSGGRVSAPFALLLMAVALVGALGIAVALPSTARTVRDAPLPVLVALVAVAMMVFVDLGAGLETDQRQEEAARGRPDLGGPRPDAGRTGLEAAVIRRAAGRMMPVAVVVAVVAIALSAVRFAYVLGVLH